ncbi:MAG: cellulase family glycosylhydrolase [Chitinispirillaceae bacterium]|nr:cellulase family glycosylhydrolase [Chitinispirillaceae bacterium]
MVLSRKLMLVAGLVVASHALAAAQNWPAHFVKRCGTEFCCGDSTFYFAGTNVYDFFTFGNGYSDQNDSLIENGYIDKARIDAHMQRMANAGVTVLRFWLFSHEQWNGFERQEGVFHEPQFKLIDYVVESAKKHRIFLIPTLENYWEAYGGIDKRLSWEGVQNGHPGRWRFFNRQVCPGCFDQYKNYARYVLNHVNHYSNVPYKNEKVIFAWDLMNEPRYQDATPNENASGATLRAWVDTMARFIKSIDANHMVYAGIEGHEQRYGFGGNEGNPFVRTQQSQWIDFTSAHPYPTEGWAALNIQQTQALVRHWIDDSRDSCKKPFFMGEFNMHNNNQYGTRAQWWQAVFETLEQAGGNGSAFWWFPDRNNDPNFGVSDSSPEMTVFKQHSQRMKSKCKPYTTALRPFAKSSVQRGPHALRTVLFLNGKKSSSVNGALFSISGTRINKPSTTGVIIVARGKGAGGI